MADSSPSLAVPLTAAPSRVRYGVLAFLCSLSFVLYIDRVCIAKAGVDMQRDLDLTNTEWGYVLGAFLVAYGLFEVPTGRWGDRYGSRGVLTRIVLWWSAFTALTGAATGLWILVGIRFLFGAGEAGALPNSARVLARWFPAAERGMAQGVVLTAALVGGALAPTVAAYLIQQIGWRWSFVAFGSLGVVWAAAFYVWFRDDPCEHPAVNEAERRLLAARRDSAPLAEHHPPIPWGAVLSSANIWLLGLIQTCGAFASYLYLGWYPTYLAKGRSVESIEAGWLSSLVLGGGAVGCLLGGLISDWLVRQTGDRRRTHSGYGAAALAVAALCTLASMRCETPLGTSLWAAAANMAALSSQAAWWGVTTEISGKHLAALFGLMNSLGVPGAFSSTVFLGRFADWMKDHGFEGRGQWDPAFYVYAAVLACGAVSWLFVNSDRHVDDHATVESVMA